MGTLPPKGLLKLFAPGHACLLILLHGSCQVTNSPVFPGKSLTALCAYETLATVCTRSLHLSF